MSIYDYYDYRKFLKDFYDQGKAEHSYFSYRYMGQKVNMDPGYLVKVVQGKWHIAEKSIPDFAKMCKLNEKESQYFETLVQFGKAKTEGDAKRFFEILLNFRDIKLDSLTAMQYEFYQKWYHSAVRAILGYYTFDGDFALLGQQLSPQITEKQARESITLLVRLELIEQDETGNYHVTKANITTGSEWSAIAISEFQKEMMKIAASSIDRIKRDKRDISTLTMAIPESLVDAIKERTREYRNAIIKLVNECDEVDSIYQLNIQFFPLTSSDDEE